MLKLFLIVGLFSFLFMSPAFAASKGAIKQAGSYLSADNKCTAILTKSKDAGFLKLYLKVTHENPYFVADDITGLSWINTHALVYSSSPVYGRPGVFLVTCDYKSHQPTTLVSPTNIDTAYPDGADYFELRSVTGRRIDFYYGPDVDKIDFKNFHSASNLHTTMLPAD